MTWTLGSSFVRWVSKSDCCVIVVKIMRENAGTVLGVNPDPFERLREHAIIIMMAVETVAIPHPLLSTHHFWLKDNEEHSIN